MLGVLVLDPDPWRYRGICSVLEESGIKILGESDFAKILTLESAPDAVQPDVVLISHRLVVDLGVSVIPHLKDLFRSRVLVCGDHDSLEVMAQVFAVGGSGYFLLSAPPSYLPTAVAVVSEGKLWGPSEVIALMTQRGAQQKTPRQRSRLVEEFSEEDMAILQYLNDGLTNKEIANRLGVAEVTVKARLTKLYKRFGVRTRLQLLSTAIREGLLDPSEHGPQTETKHVAARQ